MKKPLSRMYIIRKYVIATSIEDALKKERFKKVDDCWVDERFVAPPVENIGFKPKKENGANN